MQTPTIRLLVTDLDNTLYDWVTFYAAAFYDMVSVAARLLDVSEEALLDELQTVHQRHHNSEHPFALLEVQSVLAKYGHLSHNERAALLDEAFHQFNRTRKTTLRLYRGVLKTLSVIQKLGVPIVGHTEATVPNALFRLQFLGVDRFMDRLYAVAPLPSSDANQREANAAVESRLQVHYLSHDERKPDPRVLLDICRSTGVPPYETLYVGDSMSRDIGMAKAAGVCAAWAKYGTTFDPASWNRLVRITHWTREDVERAQAAQRRYADVQPDVILHEDFSEILRHFTFAPNPGIGDREHGQEGSPRPTADPSAVSVS